MSDSGGLDTVMAERGEPAVNRKISTQARASGILAFGLIAILVAGGLIWYYTATFHRQSQAREAARAKVSPRAEAEMPLPSLGRIELAPEKANPAPDKPAEPLPLPTVAEISSEAAPAATYMSPPATKSPAELAMERRLSGAAFAAAAVSNQPKAVEPTAASEGEAQSAGTLATLLKSDPTPLASARLLPTQRLLLPKGAFIDCTLETAIDSTLPGMTTCITAADTFSADGKVVLLERGTKLFGETRGQVQQGSSRIFVVWTEARTPTGVVVPLESPGADELGRAGLPGEVNRHFWDRFGAAILVSMVDGAIQGAVQSRSGAGAVIYNPSQASDIMTEVLKSTINIPPTVTKANGERIQVLVARDLDFRSVYALKSTAGGR